MLSPSLWRVGMWTDLIGYSVDILLATMVWGNQKQGLKMFIVIHPLLTDS